MLTPFTKDGKINEKELAKLVRYNLALGADGFYVCGSTAEALMLNAEERMEIMRIVKDNAKDANLIAHVGSLNERDAHKLAAYARDLSYDLISSVAPFYYKFSFSEIKDYYVRLAENSGMKMLVYHFPAFSGVSMGSDEISTFLGDDRFAGIKYTYESLYEYNQCRLYKNGKFDMLHGQDETILPSLAMGGAQGGIGGTTNYNGCNLVGIIDAWNAGDLEKARELQNFAQEVINVICHYRGNIVCGKRIMKLIGLDLGPNRTPFQNMTDAEEEACRKELEAINFFERCNKF